MKNKPIGVHLLGIYLQYCNSRSILCLSGACGNTLQINYRFQRDANMNMQAYTGFGGGSRIFCHMDELPGHALQAFLQNNRQSSCGCAVKQKGWDFRADFVAARGRNGEERGGLIGTEHTMSYISGASSKCALHVDFTGVPLIGANLQAVRADAQPLFVACSNNFQEIFTRYGERRPDAFKHQVDRSPSTSLQSSRMPFCIPDLGQVESRGGGTAAGAVQELAR